MKKHNYILWIFCIIVFFIYSINEWFVFRYISDFTLTLTIHLLEGLSSLIIFGFLLSDIYTKKTDYQKLKMDEERLYTLINAMVDVVIFKDGKGRWIEANEFGLKLFQLEKVDYKGKTDLELSKYSKYGGKSLLECMGSDKRAWESRDNIHVEEFIPMPDGSIKPIDTIKIPLFNEDGSRKGIVLIGRDMTNIVQAQQQLYEKEQRYRSLFRYNPEPMMMMDLNGLITKVNPRFEAVTGYSNIELLGIPFLDLHFNETDGLIDSFQYVLQNHRGINSSDVILTTKHGKKIILSCTFVPILVDHQLVGLNCYTKDITKARATQERLKNSEKLSVVGELAASVAHEVRNPLTSLKGFVQLLKGGESQNENYYEIMLSELDRINLIVSELLVLAKPQKNLFQKQQILQLLTDVKILLEGEALEHSATIQIEAKEPLPLLFCEANQLKQVFINMIKNSLEADSRHIWITVKQVNQYLSITIEDDGSGIEEDRLKHLGEPFYSSKERGTGLGLTISYRIIEAHKGKVTVESQRSKGTNVQIELPI